MVVVRRWRSSLAVVNVGSRSCWQWLTLVVVVVGVGWIVVIGSCWRWLESCRWIVVVCSRLSIASIVVVVVVGWVVVVGVFK